MQWSAQKRGKFGLENAAAQFRWRFSDALDGTDEIVDQFMDVIRTTVGQFPLGERPDSFVGVEIGCVGGKMLYAETRMLTLDLAQRFSLVSSGVVQQRNHRAAQMPEQVAEERAHLLLPDVLVVELIVETQVASSRADGDSRDDRDLVSPMAMTMNRSAATRRPGLDDVGDQQESGLVGEDEMGAQPSSVFLTRGQSFRFQRWMASSSRSRARVSGFW